MLWLRRLAFVVAAVGALAASGRWVRANLQRAERGLSCARRKSKKRDDDDDEGFGKGVKRSWFLLILSLLGRVAALCLVRVLIAATYASLLFPILSSGLTPLPVHTSHGDLRPIIVASATSAGSVALGVSFLLLRALGRRCSCCFHDFTTRNGSVFALIAWMVLGTVMGFRNTLLIDPVVKRVTIGVPNLSPQLLGYTILQLSDLHIGPVVGKRNIEGIVKRANIACAKASCDVAVLTGDIIDADMEDVEAAADVLGSLAMPQTFYVSGNHEHIHDNVDAVSEFLKQKGIHPLRNENVVLDTPRGGKIRFAGVDDLFRKSQNEFRSGLARALRGARLDTPESTKPFKPDRITTVLLAHQVCLFFFLPLFFAHANFISFFSNRSLMQYDPSFRLIMSTSYSPGTLTQVNFFQTVCSHGPSIRFSRGSTISITLQRKLRKAAMATRIQRQFTSLLGPTNGVSRFAGSFPQKRSH